MQYIVTVSTGYNVPVFNEQSNADTLAAFYSFRSFADLYGVFFSAYKGFSVHDSNVGFFFGV